MKATSTYLNFIDELKKNIVQSRYQALRLANKEQLILYLQTGKMLVQKIDNERWGTKIISKISHDLQQQLPGLRGFSQRNLLKMKQFYTDYKSVFNFSVLRNTSTDFSLQTISPLSTAQLDSIAFESFWLLSFSHHIVLLSKCKSIEERFFYMAKVSQHYWSVTTLEYQIKSNLFYKQGKLPNNFSATVSEKLQSSAVQLFKDEYLLDFISVHENDSEKAIENKIVGQIRDFILRMGIGFSFVGNQYRIELEDEEFFIDLLFFNRNLQSLVAIELKRGKFKPEFAGQMSFYLNVLDTNVKLSHENSSIGIILCKEKNNTIVEYAVKSIDRPMGVATYKTSKELPQNVKEFLPNETELKKLL